MARVVTRPDTMVRCVEVLLSIFELVIFMQAAAD
jgi:hypothetical protein